MFKVVLLPYKTSCGARHNKPRPLLPPTEWHWLVNGLIFEIPFWDILQLGATFGLYSYFQSEIWRQVLARRPRFPITATKFRAYLVELSRSPFWAIWGFWGYVATSDAKSDVKFLLGNPNFLLGRRNFAPISLSYRDPHLGLFGGFGGLGVFSYFRCKIWRHILPWRPWFPIRATKFRAYLD